jgi:hypothetical protein
VQAANVFAFSAFRGSRTLPLWFDAVCASGQSRPAGKLFCRSRYYFLLFRGGCFMLRGKANLLERFFRRIEIRDELSSEEKEALLVSAGERRSYVAGSNIVLEGDRPSISTLLLDGLASRYNLTRMAGGRSPPSTCPATSSTCIVFRSREWTTR